MTSSFRERKPELEKNTQGNRGREQDKKRKRCGEKDGEYNVW
jgi:hypothetical protein